MSFFARCCFVVLLYLVSIVTGIAQIEPTVKTSNINFSNITESSFTVNWTNGNGEKRIVIVREGPAAPSVAPVDGTEYSYNPHYPSSPMLGVNHIVYNGSLSSFNMTGLNLNKPYSFSIYEYNGSGAATNYFLSAALASQYTSGAAPEPTESSLNVILEIVSVPEYAVKVSWQNGNGERRVVFIREGQHLTTTGLPLDGYTYGADENYAMAPESTPNKVVYNGTENSFILKGISKDKIYGIGVFEYNGDGNSVNYNQSTFARNLISVSALQNTMDNFAFQYRYDARKRMTHKKVPGADWVYMVYDNRDRLVLAQDGRQRINKQWTFTKYDEFNRPIAIGIKDTTVTLTQLEMQTAVNDHYAKSWARYGESYIGNTPGNIHGYSNNSYPVFTTGTTLDVNRYLSITYYDNYTFTGHDDYTVKSYFGTNYGYVNDALKETVNGYLYEQPANEFASVIGQVTGTKVKVLDGSIIGGVAGGYTWLKSINYYDNKYRVIQTISDNYKGGTDRVSNLYDFVGKVLQSKGLHLESDVQWTDLVLNTVIGNYLQKTGSSGWTSGAASVQSLSVGQDGWVEFVASEENTARMVGLSTVNNGVNYTTIDYAIHPRTNKTVAIYEKGSPTEIGTYASGDVFRIARVGTTIKYYKNGFLKHTSSVPSTGPLLVDVSMNTTGSTVVGVKSSFSTSIHSVLRRYVYDHAGRLKQGYHTLDNGSEVLLASNEYNELGQLIDKGLHSVNGSAPMQSVDYRYNIRGWLTSMNNSQLNSDGSTNDDTGDFFGMNLAYNEDLGTGNTESVLSNASLVGSYTFNGNASDAVTDGLNGVVYGAQLTTDSQANSASAYSFTANDYIDIPNSKDKHSFIHNTGKFTISAFVKINDLSARSVIVSSTAISASKGFCFMYETYGGGYGDRQLRFMTTKGTSGVSFSALGGVGTINDNNWHHVAVVGDGNTVRFYVDGILDGSPTAITIFSTGSATGTTLIGKTRSASGLFLGMSGAIDEVNIFNEPLDQSAVTSLSQRVTFNAIQDKGQYNGNISAMKWSVNQGMGDTKEMAYNFEYDALNRLVSAGNLQSSLPGTWEKGNYHEGNLSYDLNGNIKTLSRSSEPGMIDNLVYNYGTGTAQSNKLLAVTDYTPTAVVKLKGFTDSNTSGNDYTYDVNGNMTVDLNKGLSSPITYNYLNLPEVVTKSGNTIRYIYDATGRKLSQVVRAGFGVKQTDYSAEFIYEDDMLRFINHEEGRIVMSSEKLLYKHDGETVEGLTGLNSTLTAIEVNGEKYISATAGGAGSGIMPIGNAISVNPGEKYLIRMKGYRTSAYNAGVMIRRNNSMISYGSYLPALFSNESWMEQIYVVPPNTNVLEIGVGWNGSAGNTQLYLNAFELIKLESAAPEYQYNLKDHLGNVRLTFTTKQDIESVIATLETANESSEEGKFLYYDEAIKVNNYLFDHTNNAETPEAVNTIGNPSDPDLIYEPDGYATRLTGGNTNAKYGLAKSLSVMQGDVVNAKVYAKYLDPIQTNRTVELRDFLLSIASGGSAPAGTLVDGGAAGSIGNSVLPISPINHSSETGTSPKAYLNYIVFNKDMSLVLDEGFQRITSNSREYGQNGTHDSLMVSMKIREAGYVYLYLSNESESPIEVYFDDFEIEHIKSAILQENEYYPLGQMFLSYRRENVVKQPFTFNGIEEQDEFNLNTNFAFYRMYDFTIGRWWSIDPKLNELVTPYSAMNNNPVLYSDPLGDTTQLLSTTGLPLRIINDNLPNQVHFIDQDNFEAMKQGKKESLNDFAARVRKRSVAFIGDKTVSDFLKIVKVSDDLKKEVAFVGDVSRNKEIRLTRFPVDENNFENAVYIGSQIEKYIFYYSIQKVLFLFGHVHHRGQSAATDLIAEKQLAEPTITRVDNVPYDYYPQLKDGLGEWRSTPGVVATPFGITIFPTITRDVNSYPQIWLNSYISYKFFKR